MEKNKKKVLTIISIIIISIVILTIVLSLFIKKEEKTPVNETKPSSLTLKKEITKLTDEAIFFSLQQEINDYYMLISNQETQNLLNLIDQDYIVNNSITTNNLYSVLKKNLGLVNFTAKEIYYNPGSITTYFFIKGHLIDIPLVGENYNYEENIYYLIIRDEKTSYITITPLKDINNLEEYAKNYDIKQKDIQSHFSLKNKQISEENKLTIYINEFLMLLEYDTKRAFDMLDENTKKNYENIEDFRKDLANILTKLTSKIFAYSKEDGNIVVYSVKDENENTITIEEQGVMNYKIGFVLNKS